MLRCYRCGVEVFNRFIFAGYGSIDSDNYCSNCQNEMMRWVAVKSRDWDEDEDE